MFPDKWEHDVVVIHGEDHHSLVTNHVIPQLQKEGYAVAVDVVRLGRREYRKQKDDMSYMQHIHS